MRTFSFITLLASSLLFSSSAAQSITSQNWKTHPRVVEIRNMFNDVEKLLITRSLKMQVRTVGCGDYSETRTLLTDAGGTARRYVSDGGSSDSRVITTYTYDPQGTLRFAYAKGGAVNGATAEWRQYFGPDGRRFWTDYQWRKYDYTWPDVLGTRVRDPRAEFGRTLSCTN